ncbi:Snaclec stejaggregin-A subunit alpha [Amphibalanus amphitrite]|uniref:Snaclec stejaggregin-A subunit alpha n=1 Tax=Amphibalanus amphitrite TaxID=1232801 RepID=A0A6A4WWX1_AMPAM|nr:Snaclec stejaggregin-A subunit alpha [Amphibalanus amphitrite]
MAMPLRLPAPLLLFLLSALPVPSSGSGQLLQVVPWDSADHPELALTAAVSPVQCGVRCLRWSGAQPCAALAFSTGQCRLLACPAGHSLTNGVCAPDCPAGTALENGQCVVQCPAGWVTFGNACYLRVAEARSWAASETHCGAQLSGAHLASVHSAEEETFIWNLMSSNGALPVNYHVGFKHLGTDTAFAFHWVDGTTVVYTNWRTGQPNFDQTLDLGTSMYTSGEAWCDVSYDGSYVFHSICKFAPSAK